MVFLVWLFYGFLSFASLFLYTYFFRVHFLFVYFSSFGMCFVSVLVWRNLCAVRVDVVHLFIRLFSRSFFGTWKFNLKLKWKICSFYWSWFFVSFFLRTCVSAIATIRQRTRNNKERSIKIISMHSYYAADAFVRSVIHRRISYRCIPICRFSYMCVEFLAAMHWTSLH